MTATNHVVTGMVIGTITHNPWLALPAAFASHFVLDALPHASFEIKSFADRLFKVSLVTDMSLAAICLLVVAFLQPAHFYLLLGCGVLAASPDLMWLPDFWAALHNRKMPSHGPIGHFHTWIQWYQKRPGFFIEAIWLVAMIAVLHHRA